MIGFLREVSPHLEKCELTHAPRSRIDVKLARKQHASYAEALRELGVQVEMVPPLPEQADGVFIEDTAVLLPEVSIIARPGAASRISEIDSVVQTLGQHRPLQSIAEPGTLDGGDVLRIGHTIYVAESKRTNTEGIAQLREIAASAGYEVRTVATRDCLHLKTACTFVPPHFLVANSAWIDVTVFGHLAIIPVDEKEPTGANTLTLGRTTLVSAVCPKTEKRLREAGIATRRVDISEFEKAEGGLTCLSLILESRAATAAAGEIALKSLQVADVPAPTGHASQAIVQGGFVFVSPQPPFDPAARRTSRLSAEEQAEQAIRNLSAILTAAGSSLALVVRTTIHVADLKHLPRIEAAYRRMFGAHRPARAIIANGALPSGVLVEIEAVAAVPGEGLRQF